MKADVKNILILGAAFLTLFAMAEILYHGFKVKAEFTRKFVHVCTGVLTLLFPALLKSQWSVLILCSGFAIILIASRRYRFLKSINNIDRYSVGSLAYPVSVYICFLAYKYFYKDATLFYMPILQLAIADTVAALVGKRWPYKKYAIFGTNKSVGGSMACFIVAFAIYLIFFWSNSVTINGQMIIESIYIALAVTVAEGISGKGFDNISIPITVLVILLLFKKTGY